MKIEATPRFEIKDQVKQKEKKEKQESNSEKQERLIIFWLKQKWITYKWLKLKIKELEENQAMLKEFPDDEQLREKVKKLEEEINSKAKIIKVKDEIL